MMLGDFILDHEWFVRLTAFTLTLTAMVIWERVAPRRMAVMPRLRRWKNNLALFFIDVATARIIFPAAVVGFAIFAEARGIGVLPMLELPFWIAIAASVVLLDFTIYLQHLVFHALPLFWRLHQVHHADIDFDVTTGVRFHPLEILLSIGIKFLIIVTLGPPVVAVLIFEALLNVTAMFNHSNIALPNRLDKVLRALIVTPDMHRIHHSIERIETDSNFGFCFSVWDRLMGTYREAPALGHAAMVIGVPEFRDPEQVVTLKGMLTIPFRKNKRPESPTAGLRKPIQIT